MQKARELLSGPSPGESKVEKLVAFVVDAYSALQDRKRVVQRGDSVKGEYRTADNKHETSRHPVEQRLKPALAGWC